MLAITTKAIVNLRQRSYKYVHLLLRENQMTTDEALEKLPELLKRDLTQPLCVCNQVIKLAVIEAIAQGADTVEKVQQKTCASDGTGCCKHQIQDLINAIVMPNVKNLPKPCQTAQALHHL